MSSPNDSPEPTSLDRKVQLEGAWNVRDLGGLRGHDGRALRRGLVFRADGLHSLTGGDSTVLEALSIQRVFDLRSDVELAKDGLGPFAQASDRHRHRPLVGVTLSPFDPSIDWAKVELASRYVHMLREGAAVIAEILEWLAVPEQVPTLFHCTAGKDRTGVVAAVLLAALSVPYETIVADYAQSGVNLQEPLTSRRQAMLDYGLAPEAVEYLTTAPAERMRVTLSRLDEEWGGVAGYLKTIPVEAGLQERLQQVLLAS